MPYVSARPWHCPRTASILFATLAACASYTPAPIDLDRAPRELEQRRLDAPELRAFVERFLGSEQANWPAEALTLEELQAIALHHRAELVVAWAEFARASAGRDVATQLDNPRVTVAPGIVTNPGGADRWLAAIGLLFPLDLGGRRDARAQIAASEVTAARVALARTDLAVRADVVESAFADEHTQLLAGLAAERAELLREAAALVETRAAHGAADAGELAAARSAAAQALLERNAAERERRAARQALAAAIGLPADVLREHRLQLPAALAAPPDGGQGAAAAAARQHLDVAAALGDYQRREGELRLAVAAQWPDLELGPGYEYDQGLHKLRLDLGFTLPLFHGAGAAIEAAKAARTHAAAAVAAAQTRAYDGTLTAAVRLAATPPELADAVAAAQAAAARVRAAEQRAARGSDDRGAVIAAHLDDVAARLAAVAAVHDARIAWLQYERAAQQPAGPGLLAWQHPTPGAPTWPTSEPR